MNTNVKFTDNRVCKYSDLIDNDEQFFQSIYTNLYSCYQEISFQMLSFLIKFGIFLLNLVFSAFFILATLLYMWL